MTFDQLTAFPDDMKYLSFAFLAASLLPFGTGCSQDKPDDNGTPEIQLVAIPHPDINGAIGSVSCLSTYLVDVSAWPADGYPAGASGLYRYVNDDRYEGPKDGKLPDGTVTGFIITRHPNDLRWTIMSTLDLEGKPGGYPWDYQNISVNCPDGNATWFNGATVQSP